MPVELQYLPDYQLVFERFSGVVTFEEIRDINQQFLDLVEQLDKKVTTLVDLQQVEKYPTSINQLRDVLRVSRNPHIGWVVIVTSNSPLLKLGASVLTQVSVRGVRFRLFEDSLEALRFIESLQAPSNSVLPLDEQLSNLFQQTP
jgi:hypothetical protein